MKKFIPVLLFLLAGSFAFGSTIYEQDFTCPLCGKSFTATLQGSGSEFGRNLDLKATGAIIIPWPIPQCPDCRFAFTEKFFTEEDLVILKDYTRSAGFAGSKYNVYPYWCLAREMAAVGKNVEDIAFTYLKAVWESGDPGIIAEAIGWFEKIPRDSQNWLTSRLLLVELNRRIGQFERAAALCAEVRTLPDCQGYIVTIVKTQESLIAAKDTGEHPLPEAE
jgi:hypothetical protein